MKSAASEFKEIGDVIGGTMGALISNLGSLSSSVLEVANAVVAFDKAASTMEKATAAISGVGAAVSIISLVIDVWKEAKAANEAAADAAREYAITLRELEDAARISNYSNIFGTDKLGMLYEYTKLMDEASEGIKAWEDELEKSEQTSESWWETIKKLFAPGTFGVGFWSSIIGRITDSGAFKDGQLVSDKRTWIQKLLGIGGDNVVTANLSDFLDENNKLNGEALKEWYEKYGDGLEKEQKDVVENLIAEWERYEKATEEIMEYMKSVFGDSASSMADAMIEAFAETGDAATDLGSLVSDVAKKMAKDWIVGKLMDNVFNEEAQRKVSEMLAAGDIAGATNFYNDLIKQAEQTAPQVTEFLKSLNVDWSSESQRQGATKGIAQASQDSVDELNGRATVIQQHTFELNETVKEIKVQNTQLVNSAAEILLEVRGIHRDTTNIMDCSEDMQRIMAEVRGDVSRMFNEGVILRR